MKKMFVFLCALSIVACKQEPKDYVTFSGKITNQNSDSLLVGTQTYSKTIKVNSDGTFKDTLKIKEPGVFALYDGKASIPVFLRNGFELNMDVDAQEFDKTLKFSGIGSENNNFLAEQQILQEKLLDQDKLSSLNREELTNELQSAKKELHTFYNRDKSLDSLLVVQANRNLEPMLAMYENYFLESIAVREQFPVGSPSPTFENYENFKGGTTSLEDLKGKYVYIDVWATWCGPCIAEIPSIKKLESQYKDKNIQFLSISIDDAMRSGGGDLEVAKNKWKTMVEKESLVGIHLFSDKNWESDFIRNYNIQGIPRFILIDPNGNVVDANAPRPSSKKLVEMFDGLGI
ncbi:MAG: TlpA disulfide reductase family protein [Gelidibacter sp.]